MDFWNTYKTRAAKDFGKAPIYLATAERKNASLNAVSEFSRELEANKAMFQHYDEAHRYIIARDITHEILFVAYDVNSSDTLAARITGKMHEQEWASVYSHLRKIKLPNVEFRLIGLQSGGLTASLTGFDKLHNRVRGVLAEVDIFGINMRHIVIDTKTGVPYDLLLLNRIYRSGELANTLSVDDFLPKIAQLSFV